MWLKSEMPVSISQDGSIQAVAITRFPRLRRPKQTPISTRTIIGPEGLTILSSMPGFASDQPIVSRIEFSAADLVAILRAKLSSDGAIAEKLRQAILDIDPETAEGWVKYFLKKLS